MTSDEYLLPAPGHLYTWVDVDAHFAELAARNQWPEWLLEVDGYWDGVEFTVTPEVSADDIWSWLAERLGPLTVDPHRQAILLESTGDGGRPLDVRLRPEPEWEPVARSPRWGERRVVRELAENLPPPEQASFPHGVPICAFHSFKGGVGRTLHCLALARELAQRGESRSRVLLVDADMEAPGISWMVAAEGNRLDIALDDFVALLHGSTDGGAEAIALARKFLLNQERDGVVVLPTTRAPARIRPPRIAPVDLLTPNRPPYLLTEKLAELAHAVGAGTVVVDLRAGTSELNAPILLDPRVHRVFVTTLSEQSVRGTTHLLDAVARLPRPDPRTPPAPS
ncbi:MAG TPA: hypothetical protein VFX70_21095 [Mycobacteriales bacterium]|nr:hypothetical protein [Mycobacteriales bacterium]